MQHFRGRKDMPNILFGLSGQYRLTEVKVVPLTKFQSNPNTPSVWHLISDSNSVPIKMFTYGEYIHGMRPKYKGDRPQELVTNEIYRLFVAAGRAKGQIDFKVKQ